MPALMKFMIALIKLMIALMSLMIGLMSLISAGKNGKNVFISAKSSVGSPRDSATPATPTGLQARSG